MITTARALPTVVIIALASILDAGDFGKVALLVISSTLVSAIADGGLDSATTARTAAKNDQEVAQNIAALRYVRFIITCIASTTVVFPAIYNITGSLSTTFALGGLATVGALVAAENSTLRVAARLSNGPEALLLFIEKFLFAVIFGGSALFLSGHGPVVIIICYLSAAAVAPITAYPLVWRHRGILPARLGIRQGSRECWKLVKSSTPFLVSACATAAYWRTGTFLLERYGGSQLVGHYSSASYPILLQALVPGNSVGRVLMGKRVQRQASPQRLLVAGFVAGIGCCFFTIFALTPLCQRFGVGGIDAAPSAHALTIMALGLPAIWVNPLLAGILRRGSAAPLVTVSTLVGLLVAVGFGFGFIPQYGVSAAAWSLVVVEWSILVVQFVILSLVVKKHDIC